MAHELAVWLFDRRIGELTLHNGRLQFRYSSEWLAAADASPLSCSLPLQSDAFDDHQARPFFAGLLPEGHVRRLLARQLQVSGQNDFALLDHLGGECAGAVSLLPTGQTPPPAPDAGEIHWLADDELIAILDELPERPMLAGTDGLRLSLAGAQDKLPVISDGQRIGLPLNGAPSTHILKPAIRAVEDSVTNEGFCLAVAEAMRLNPARSRIHTVGDRRFLMVERYDRIPQTDGHRLRLHQEDFCQALGIVPEMKYQNEGGPSLADCFALLRRVTRPSAPQLLRLFDYVIFNTLIGNHDAHAKNFSPLYSGDSVVLAPCYDVLSTAVYPSLTPKMVMKIGSKSKFSEVEARHWEQFAEAAGLAKGPARKRVLEVAQALPGVARRVMDDPGCGFAGRKVVGEIVGLIEQRCELTIGRLGR